MKEPRLGDRHRPCRIAVSLEQPMRIAEVELDVRILAAVRRPEEIS